MPEAVRMDMELYVGCVAGALERNEYIDKLLAVTDGATFAVRTMVVGLVTLAIVPAKASVGPAVIVMAGAPVHPDPP